MKLTQRLLETHKGFWFKQLWKRKSQAGVIPAKIPDALVKAGMKPTNAVAEFFPSQKPTSQVWVPPDDPRFMFPPREEDDPNWHPEKALTFDNRTRMWEGVKQIQCLTNTLVEERLPADISEYQEDFPDIHHFMQRSILQANLWDTAREPLPRRTKPADISLMNYKAEFGIPQARIVNTMLRSIATRSLQILSTRDHPSAKNRLFEDHLMRTDFTHGDEPVYLSCDADVLICAGAQLSAPADHSQVEETKYSPVEDLFPVTATVDLDRRNIYHTRRDMGHAIGSPESHHHTLLLSMNPDWSVDQRHASALLRSYGHCVEMARRRGVADLRSKPLYVQTIHTDGQVFGFTGFQLNTLSTDFRQAIVRNQAWVHDDRLYVKETPRRAMLRNTKYHSYNPRVAHRIMAMLSWR